MDRVDDLNSAKVYFTLLISRVMKYKELGFSEEETFKIVSATNSRKQKIKAVIKSVYS